MIAALSVTRKGFVNNNDHWQCEAVPLAGSRLAWSRLAQTRCGSTD